MTRNFTDINSERGQEKRTLEILQKAISESESPEEDFALQWSHLVNLYSMKQASRPDRSCTTERKERSDQASSFNFMAWLP